MDELKPLPCPFCGGEAFHDVMPGYGLYDADEHYVGCKPCDVGFLEDSAAAAFAAWNRRADENRWIPVSERLPEEEHLVLLCSESDGVVPGQLNYLGCNWSSEEVTHWMPLPSPPEGAKG